MARHLAAGTLDRRTGVARELEDTAGALAADRGGFEHCTAGERILIERAAAETLFLRLIEAWAFRQASIVVEAPEGPQLLGPLAKGYTSHLGALTRALAALGLRPDKVERLPDLGEYISRRGNGGDAASTAQPTRATPAASTGAAVDTADIGASTDSEAPA